MCPFTHKQTHTHNSLDSFISLETSDTSTCCRTIPMQNNAATGRKVIRCMQSVRWPRKRQGNEKKWLIRSQKVAKVFNKWAATKWRVRAGAINSKIVENGRRASSINHQFKIESDRSNAFRFDLVRRRRHVSQICLYFWLFALKMTLKKSRLLHRHSRRRMFGHHQRHSHRPKTLFGSHFRLSINLLIC